MYKIILLANILFCFLVPNLNAQIIVPQDAEILRSTDAENEFVLLINEHRESKGLAPLCVLTSMTEAAAAWNAEVASWRKFPHQHSEDFTTGLIPGEFGITTENVGWTNNDLAVMMQSFLDSYPHRNNIENPAFTHIGIGVHYIENHLFTTHRFAQITVEKPCVLPTEACSPPYRSQNTSIPKTTSSVELKTTAPGISYKWRYKVTSSPDDYIELPETSSPSIIIDDINYGYYQYQVSRTCNNNISSDWSALNGFQTKFPEVVCLKPSGTQLSENSITLVSAKIQTSLGGALYYSWRYKKSSSTEWTETNNTFNSLQTLKNLNDNTSYDWQCKLRCNNGKDSDWTETRSFTTLASQTCTPSTIGQNTTVEVTTNSAKIKTSAFADKFEWRYKKKNTSSWTYPPATSAKFIKLNGLSPGTAYHWENRKTCSNDLESNWSQPEYFTTRISRSCPRPAVIQNSATEITVNSAKLQTTASGKKYFWRYRKTSSNDWTVLEKSTVNNSTISGLSPNTLYVFQSRIQCLNSYASLWSNDRYFKTLNFETCSVATIGQNTTVSVTTSSAKIQTSAFADKFEWRFKKINARTSWTYLPASSAKYKNLNGLSSGTTYHWENRKTCSNGDQSDWSQPEYFTTTRTTQSCARPTLSQNSVTRVTTNYAQLQTSATARRYDWQYKKSSSTNWINVEWSYSKQKTIYGLSSNTQYDYRSRVQCSNYFTSQWSEKGLFKTNAVSVPDLTNTETETRSYSKDNNAEHITTSLNLKIYPNPASNYILIDLDEKEDFTIGHDIEIFDNNGLSIRKYTEVKTNSMRIDLNGLSSGVYFIKVNNDKSITTSKIVVR